MGLVLLVAFIGVPLIEIALFIQVGDTIGLWPTIAVVVLTAVAGTSLLRHQGLGALAKLQDSLNRGELPLDTVFDGFCLLAAGMLLLTPGFFTDGIGFLLFIPPFRTVLKRLVTDRVKVQAHHQAGSSQFHGQNGGPAPSQSNNADIIDGDYQDVTERGDQPRLPDDLKPRP
ncbi:MAG: FxsA family protein [Magnetovibrio sp.]|nr:FxsA family protein [Magnetovibrio sp.]